LTPGRWRWIQRDGSYILGKVLKLHRLWTRIYCSFCEWKRYIHQLVSLCFYRRMESLAERVHMFFLFWWGHRTQYVHTCVYFFFFCEILFNHAGFNKYARNYSILLPKYLNVFMTSSFRLISWHFWPGNALLPSHLDKKIQSSLAPFGLWRKSLLASSLVKWYHFKHPAVFSRSCKFWIRILLHSSSYISHVIWHSTTPYSHLMLGK
jgi:hypothetical protein